MYKQKKIGHGPFADNRWDIKRYATDYQIICDWYYSPKFQIITHTPTGLYLAILDMYRRWRRFVETPKRPYCYDTLKKKLKYRPVWFIE